MLVKRDLTDSINAFLKRKEFIAIIGPRQSGKTILLEILKEHLLKDLKVGEGSVRVITFEDRRLIIEFENDPVSFVRSYMPEKPRSRFYLMIDEFQYAEKGGQKLKLIYDTVKDIKVIVTGSSSLDIKAQVGKYMVGRALNFCLYPFNFGEYLRAKDKRLEKIYAGRNEDAINMILRGRGKAPAAGEDAFSGEFAPQFERFCVWGGYPAVVLAKNDLERRKLLQDTYNNYILKDIKTLLEMATEKKLFLLSQYLATQIGSTVVYENLGNASGLDYRNLKQHINVLYETFICREVRPFFKNRQKELSKNPKIFFLDLGFRNYLMDNMNGLEKRSDAGAVAENACFVRLNELTDGVNRINFWRTKAGAEVDFVMHIADEIVPIEIKYANFRGPKMSRSLAGFIDSFKPSRAIVLTKDFWGRAKREKTKILFIPAYYL